MIGTEGDTPNICAEAALRYVEIGYPVFPCKPGEKRPDTAHGFKDATTDPAVIRRWWQAAAHRNPAIATAGVVVLDLDAADHLWREMPYPDGTPISRTPRGGWHFWFRRPLGKKWACSQNEIGDKVDIRTDGGYAVEAPSVTEDGTYKWVAPLVPLDQLPEPPEWLVVVLDEYHSPRQGERNAAPDPTSPGTDFNLRGTWEEAGLEAAGWRWHRKVTDASGYLTRPGKAGAVSASVGMIRPGSDGGPRFFSFTGNGPPIPANEPLSRFAVYTYLNHGGDFSAAASALRKLGYGTTGPTPTMGDPDEDGPPDEFFEFEREEGRSLDHQADDPFALAFTFRDTIHRPNDSPTLHWYRETFYQWQEGGYTEVPSDGLAASVAKHADGRLQSCHEAAVHDWVACGQEGRRPAKKKVTRGLVADVTAMLGSIVYLPSDRSPPFWVDGDGSPPGELIPFRNGLLNPTTGELVPPTPRFFTINTREYDYDPKAADPRHWFGFLDSVWPGDEDTRNALQEFMGLLLTPDQSHRKIATLIGPTAAGKSLVSQLVCRLVGPRNYVGTSLSELGTDFGLWPLLNKSVIALNDCRIGNPRDYGLAKATERVLSISGGDVLTVNRKNASILSVRLPGRLMLLSNEIPALPDVSGALTERLLVLRFTRSFLGQEDKTLIDKFVEELPGICNWALAGLVRLRARGGFVQPAAGLEVLDMIHDAASPVGRFVRDRCTLDPSAWTPTRLLFDAWCQWGKTHHEPVGSEIAFGKAIVSAVPGLSRRRMSTDGRPWGYDGIRLN